MPLIERSALVPYSAEQMFTLVNDIPQYPQFLPWCGKAWILEHAGSEMVARIEIRKGAVQQGFTTRNILTRPSHIHLKLVEGPFRRFQGSWNFKALSEDASKVSLALDFDFSRAIAGIALAPVFSQAANSMVEAFCQRAKAVFSEDIGVS